MCLLTVHEGSRTSTILQGMAHNAGTVSGDCDAMEELLAKRGHTEALTSVRAAHSNLVAAYRQLLAAYGRAVSELEPGHEHHEVTGNEAAMSPIQRLIRDDARDARPYETR